MQPVTRTVMKMVPQEREVVVNQISYRNEERKGVRLVSSMVPEVQKFTVNVVSCQPVQKEGTRTYYVAHTVPTKTKVMQQYCDYEQYQYTVRVPVYTPVAACAPAPACVGPVAGYGHH